MRAPAAMEDEPRVVPQARVAPDGTRGADLARARAPGAARGSGGAAGERAVGTPLEGAVERARSGDRSAFAHLYTTHAAMVHGILIASVPPGAAEDLVQDAFLAAWQGLAGLRDPSRFGAWLAGIARNLARRHHRAPAATEPLTAAHAELAAPRSGDARESQRGERARDPGAILAALRELPEAYRETLALRLVEDLTGPEIAAATGRTPGAVRVNLSRGMKLLREKLRRGGLA